MRVKVGNEWFSDEPGRPIAVELTLADRRNIANMLPEATRYGQFSKADDDVPVDIKRQWMAD
ncbi:hypothetical protein [Sphingobium cloacae]|uniref:hypothetical protein n=1 Tax=Sphingobium cloacae TaxID=120107 RepID=UPI0008326149|nr:hypothetical protein [Sphingobium cloacae]